MTLGEKILVSISAAGIAIAGIVWLLGAPGRADDEAIGKAVACTMEITADGDFAHNQNSTTAPLDYGQQIAARSYGERLYRQVLADLEAKGYAASQSRATLVARACHNAINADPAPLPLVTK